MLLLVCVNILPHNNGIIHYDAQDHNEGEEAYQTDRNVHRGHKPKSAEK